MILRTTKRFSTRTVLILGCVISAAAAVPCITSAQEKTAPTETVKPVVAEVVTKEIVETRIKEAQEIADEKLRARVIDLYKQALDPHLKNAENFAKKIAEFEAMQKDVQKRIADLKAEIEKPIDVTDPMPDDELSTTELEQQLVKAKQEQTKAKEERNLLETEPAKRVARRTIALKRIEEVKKDLLELADPKDTQPKVKKGPDEPAEVLKALKTLQDARKQAYNLEVKALETELAAYDATVDLLTVQIRAANRRVLRADRLVDYWENVVKQRIQDEAGNQERAAKGMLAEFQKKNRPAVLIKIAKENLDYAQRRTKKDGLVQRLEVVGKDIKSAEAELDRLKSERKTIEEKLTIPDIEEVIGPLLLNQRRKLPNTGVYQRKINQRGRDLSRLRLELMNVQQQSEDLAAFDDKVEQIVKGISGLTTAAAKREAADDVKKALKFRQTLLDSLVKDYNSLLNQSSTLGTKERQLVDATTEFRKLIDKHILWIPSTTPLGVEHISDAGSTVEWLLSVKDWKETVGKLWASLKARPVLSALAVFLLALALLKEKPMRDRLNTIGERSGRKLTEPFLYTIQAAALTVALSAIWPMALWFIGWHLVSFPDTTEFAASVGTGLEGVAFSLLTLEILRRMFRPLGMAEAHFRWRDKRLKSVRRNLRWFGLIVLPCAFLFILINDYEVERYSASLGRLLLIVMLATWSVFMAVVLRWTQKQGTTVSADHASATKQRSIVHMVVYVVAVGSPVILAIMAGTGYLYTATLLTKKLLQTAWLGLVLLVFHAMAVRWLYYARGILALNRVQAQTAAATPEEEKEPKPSANGAEAKTESRETTTDSSAESKSGETKPAAPARVAEEIEPIPVTDLATINSQTRRILKIALGCAAFVGLWMVWGDVLPALKFLDYPLWTTQSETTKMVPGGAEGMLVPQSVPVLKAFTYGHLILAIAILVISFIAAGNIPGLLEVGILQKLPIDSGIRYATATLARYSIYAAGIIVSFNLMGFGWSKLQWLVAAVGVGLGFGLQEVFANFICGLILLFERPLRVGDVVTIGDITGTVTRIQIRATTIRNWDRKEFIVPNKDLITGKLLNWTLTDRINRIVINVGVKYGSDGDTVREILLDVLKQHPQVLADPPPAVTFEGFGDSALNFVVRCHVGTLEHRLETIHQLHTEIQRRLGKADIEIPFPQRDLHIRSDDTQRNGLRRESQDLSAGDAVPAENGGRAKKSGVSTGL